MGNNQQRRASPDGCIPGGRMARLGAKPHRCRADHKTILPRRKHPPPTCATQTKNLLIGQNEGSGLLQLLDIDDVAMAKVWAGPTLIT